jgi:hypothetical protein
MAFVFPVREDQQARVYKKICPYSMSFGRKGCIKKCVRTSFGRKGNTGNILGLGNGNTRAFA